MIEYAAFRHNWKSTAAAFMHSMRNRLQSKLIALTLSLMLLALWLLVRGYQGFEGDAQLYAFQALARIHTGLSTDLYFQNNSQDQYTLFSPFYAWFVGLAGLQTAARLLTLFFTTWFVVAAWNLAAAVTQRGTAWLAVAFVAVTTGDYGAGGVFHISEQFLTARLPAEALVITAFALYVRGERSWGLAIAITALLVHPLMALPGVLLLIFAWLPFRVSLITATGGILATLTIAVSAATLAPTVAPLIMDSDWLEMVRERSQFLFLQLWSFRDWDINLRPLVYLVFITISSESPRLRKFCIAGVILGISGLSVALIASLIGPVPLLLQVQTWRWMWTACLLSVLFLPATILKVWHDEKCGPFCAALLIGGWLVPGLGGTAFVVLGLMFAVAAKRIPNRAAAYLRLTAAIFTLSVLVSVGISSLAPGHMRIAEIRNNLGMKVAAVVLFVFLWWLVQVGRPIRITVAVFAVVFTSLFWIVPASFNQARILRPISERVEFSDWIDAIPATSTVLVAPARDVGTFVWFTLMRPNYLALDQSSGVVFSRLTSLEVRRRSELLLPLTEPTWRILSGNRRAVTGAEDYSPTRPLSTGALIEVCSDPSLGFVISPQNVGFSPKRHANSGAWKDWNLYDCNLVRSISHEMNELP
jgi:hypothetical protein